MLGELNNEQIEELLTNQAVGRIGCHSGGVTYIVPINYLYENSVVYAHSAQGMKIEKMRENPDVCFEVDKIEAIVNWQSVIAWGKFEEVTDMQEQEGVMRKLIMKVMPLMNSKTNHPSHGITANESDIGNKKELIVYKITLNHKTGRFETS
ncbi:pyridoxamine 5'-phosphate oxidase family protein [Mucilaginibacter xinganensis]|uniref:Pyridoxamine 5'-phosphate oxidase n=1 Tax=Mucilaginibacter xinganensis TaxID=1234841 RepID=A0A223NY20_9SPHI|nr:pyridoxamine 5'-phosphate oxidase family protein [Mucilaginibacter xinganensis]ASU34779.1 pyridoxamine 5'-phosphate oxidase [Mucilaginibacter xinganensis]